MGRNFEFMYEKYIEQRENLRRHIHRKFFKLTYEGRSENNASYLFPWERQQIQRAQ